MEKTYENKSPKERQEIRLSDNMSGVVIFTSQCKGCRYNNAPKCFMYGEKPEEFRNNDKKCPNKS